MSADTFRRTNIHARPSTIPISRAEAELLGAALQEYRDSYAEQGRATKQAAVREFCNTRVRLAAELAITLNARLFPEPVEGPDPRD